MKGSDTPKLALEFAFPAELSSSLPTTDVVDCYLFVLSGTTVKDDISKAMLPLFLHGQTTGNTRLTTAAFGPLLSEGMSFSWPWFDEWLEHFRSEHLLPERWEAFADKVKDRRGRITVERIPLLADTIGWMCHNRRLANQHASYLQAELNGHRKVFSYALKSECAASQSLHARRLERLVPGDWRTYPPFFPGDRTMIRREGKWE